MAYEFINQYIETSENCTNKYDLFLLLYSISNISRHLRYISSLFIPIKIGNNTYKIYGISNQYLTTYI